MSTILGMTKLNQMIAVQQGVKSRTQAVIDSVYHQLQKTPLFDGLTKTYQPRDDEDVRFPDEGIKVQLKAWELLDEAAAAWTRMLDVMATVDATNTATAGQVMVDGVAITDPLPVTTLLSLEKQLTGVRTLISKLPVQDPAKDWHLDPASDAYSSAPVQSFKTRKVLRNHVKAEATDKHPAQVDVYTEDVVQGTWTKVDFTGALPAARKRQLLARVDKLAEAVKVAREEANSASVEDVKIGKQVFDYLLAP